MGSASCERCSRQQASSLPLSLAKIRPGTMRQVLIVAQLASAFSSVQGQWQFTVKKDEMTDEQHAVFMLRASTQTRNTAGLPTTPALVLRCSAGGVTDVYVIQDAYVGDQTSVQLR